tara:strand:+ start:1830 stop:2933 length:1104 start_codon:yes stop_codon:yes gene_type:complete
MTFFNKKEEVIDIQLTSYGKYLLSKGKLKPAFYAFSDDEVVYDPSFNNSGSVEVGQETFRRIVEDGISTRALYDGESAEGRVNKLNGHVTRTDKQTGRAIRVGKISKTPTDDVYGKDYIDDISMVPVNRGLVTNLLSTSRLGEKYVPAISVKSLNNYARFELPIELSSSRDSTMDAGMKVPQLNIEIDYRTFEYDYDIQDAPEAALDLQSEYDKDIIFKDGKRLLIDDRSVTLDFLEKNITSFGDGFEYEMFIVEHLTDLTRSKVDGSLVVREYEVLKNITPGLNSEQFDDKVLDISTYVEIRTDDGIPEKELEDSSNSDDILRIPTLDDAGANPILSPNRPGANTLLRGTVYNNFKPIDPEEGDCE